MRAETIARVFGGRKVGGGWMARCPAHDNRSPSLAIHDADDGKVLVCCHAGCDQARVIEALRAGGLWSNRLQQPIHAIRATHYQARADAADRDDDKRTEAITRIGARLGPLPARSSRPICGHGGSPSQSRPVYTSTRR